MGANVAILNTLESREQTQVLLPITAVERETGVSKELLRMWERRYGFPKPLRDTMGDRVYSLDQVARLRVMRRLIDAGFRPGKLAGFETEEMERMLQAQNKARHEVVPGLEEELLRLLKTREPAEVREYVSHQLIRLGLERFVLDFLQHAQAIIGDAWLRGQIDVHEEHLFTDQVQTQIRHAIGNLRDATRAPRILLTTPSEEPHTMGILMVESLLRLDDVDAVCYGAEMPYQEVVQAVRKHKMDIVALSFSAAYPASKAITYLEELRFRLPLSVDIWGGGGALRNTRRSIEAVTFFHDLPSLRQAVAEWRRGHGVT